jgi:hypothetical protein
VLLYLGTVALALLCGVLIGLLISGCTIVYVKGSGNRFSDTGGDVPIDMETAGCGLLKKQPAPAPGTPPPAINPRCRR